MKIISLGITALLAIWCQTGNAATSIPHFQVNCPVTTATQICSTEYRVPTTTTADWTQLQIKYDVYSGHCASIRLHIFVDGALVKTTGFFGWYGAPAPYSSLPLTTGVINLNSVKPGAHVISLLAEGQTAGCNSGSMSSSAWAGALQILP